MTRIKPNREPEAIGSVAVIAAMGWVLPDAAHITWVSLLEKKRGYAGLLESTLENLRKAVKRTVCRGVSSVSTRPGAAMWLSFEKSLSLSYVFLCSSQRRATSCLLEHTAITTPSLSRMYVCPALEMGYDPRI